LPRNNIVGLIAGGRGTGKTTFARAKIVDPQWTGKQKVLVVDTFRHHKYKDLKQLTPTLLPKWKSGTYFLGHSDVNKTMRYITTMPNMYNSIIVFEDATKYIQGNVPDNIRKFILDTKQKNIDVYFLYHALQRIPPFMCENSDVLFLLKTNDVDKNASRFAERDAVLQALRANRKAKEWYYPKNQPIEIKLN